MYVVNTKKKTDKARELSSYKIINFSVMQIRRWSEKRLLSTSRNKIPENTCAVTYLIL